MSRVFWVRHGPTHAKTIVGWSDLPADLSDTARIARLDRHLPEGALLVSSDLRRAVQTADAIGGARQRLGAERDLREIHFGEWEMRDFGEGDDLDHQMAFWERPGDVRAPGGETWNEVKARVDRAVERLLRANPGRDLIAVAHLGVILTQVQRALDVSAYEAFGQKIDNLSVTELHRREGRWHAAAINHCP